MSPKDPGTPYYNVTVMLFALSSAFIVVASIAAYYVDLDIGQGSGSVPFYYLAFGTSAFFSCLLIAFARLFYKSVSKEIDDRLRISIAANSRLKEAYVGLMEALTVALDTRDHETYGHSTRVVKLALAISESLNMTPTQRKALVWGGLLHDIGKIGIPDAILFKPGRLTPDEREIMQRHTEIGYRMIRSVTALRDCRAVVLHHHEKWDGTGYPFGLKGEAIPLEARIFAVADAVDAMMSRRPYKEPMPLEAVYREVATSRGSHFCPDCADAFLKLPRERVLEILTQAEGIFDAQGMAKFADELLAPVDEGTDCDVANANVSASDRAVVALPGLRAILLAAVPRRS